MKLRRFIISMSLLVLVSVASLFLKKSFDEIVFGDTAYTFTGSDMIFELDKPDQFFLDENLIIDYYDGIFNKIELSAETEANIIVKNIHSKYQLLSSKDKGNAVIKAKLISKFVLEAKEIERVIDDLTRLYLINLKTDLMQYGYFDKESELIVGEFKEQHVISWQRNLIIEALEE